MCLSACLSCVGSPHPGAGGRLPMARCGRVLWPLFVPFGGARGLPSGARSRRFPQKRAIRSLCAPWSPCRGVSGNKATTGNPPYGVARVFSCHSHKRFRRRKTQRPSASQHRARARWLRLPVVGRIFCHGGWAASSLSLLRSSRAPPGERDARKREARERYAGKLGPPERERERVGER